MDKPHDSNKIPVVYILSNGRSGSTLLDLLLGTHPKVWTLGEAQMLPWSVKEDAGTCGCGDRLSECKFWGPLLSTIPINVGSFPIEYFRGPGGEGKVLRWGLLPGLVRGEAVRQWREPAEEYGQLNAQYFRAIWRAAEEHREAPITWLVDASKDPYRLLWMRSSGLFNLRVIHLMKDPRAYVYSQVKGTPRRALGKTVRFTGRWIVENSFFSHLCRIGFLQEETFRLRYEELAARPKETLSALWTWLGLEFVDHVGDFRNYENHAIAGNKMRWEKTDIRLDDHWRNELPSSSARVTWTLTCLLARAYGYR